MLALRRGVVTGADEPSAGGIQHLEVEVEGSRRRAYVDTVQLGRCAVGDQVVLNIEAVELRLGSGGEDVVLVNLTSGLNGEADDQAVNSENVRCAHLLNGCVIAERPGSPVR